MFKPRPQQTPVEWCESQLALNSLATSYPGPYSTRMTPYVREILGGLVDYNIERVICCFGAQTSKTNTYMAAVAWLMANEPGPVMWVMPNKNLAADFSERRLQPFLLSSAEIQGATTGKRNDIKRTEMTFSTATLTLVGSNSPANLASRPVRYLFLDEVDKFPGATKKEANAVDLATERTRSFPERKIFLSSTPTIADATIWQEYLNGDQRRYFVPCPHCGKSILLVFNPQRTAFTELMGCEARLEWAQDARRRDGWDLERVERTAHFTCPYCKGEIRNESKPAMLRAGQWRPTNAQYSGAGVRSYHLPTFYAPWPNANWGKLAVEFLKAKASIEGLRNFINSVCAEPDIGQYEGGAGARRELITLTATADTTIQRWRIMTVDVQNGYFYYLARDWFAGGASELVEWARADTYDDLLAAAARLKACAVGLDNGYDTTTVNSRCAEYGWFTLRGDDRETWPYTTRGGKKIERPFTFRNFDPLIGRKGQGTRTVLEIRWSNPMIKDILARLRDSQNSPVRWAIPQHWATEEYFRHLNGEWKKRVFNARTGKACDMWVRRSTNWPNHLLDCECMQIAAALFNGILKSYTPD